MSKKQSVSSDMQKKKDYQMAMKLLRPFLVVITFLLTCNATLILFPDFAEIVLSEAQTVYDKVRYGESVDDPYEGAYDYESNFPKKITLKETVAVEVQEIRVTGRFRGETKLVQCKIFAGQEAKILLEDKSEFGALLAAEYQAADELREGECEDGSKIHLSHFQYSSD